MKNMGLMAAGLFAIVAPMGCSGSSPLPGTAWSTTQFVGCSGNRPDSPAAILGTGVSYTYQMNFHNDSGSVMLCNGITNACGSWTASLTVAYAANASMAAMAGCTVTYAITGYYYEDNYTTTPNGPLGFAVAPIDGGMGTGTTVTATGCTATPSMNHAALSCANNASCAFLNENIAGGFETFNINGRSAMASGMSGTVCDGSTASYALAVLDHTP